MPLCTLITPNLPEAATLAPGNSVEDQANGLLDFGAEAVLIKGGHGTSDKSIDRLFQKNQANSEFASKRLNTSLRGTGCILASAIAAHLSAGEETVDACRKAKGFVSHKLRWTASDSVALNNF